ncbi:MAG: glycoside hydrolase family 3 C-terminal domain-containing protein [Oscillospiraceae bacterium]|jgi:beta-glucosidase|nr:glycoside hydrolase family 3 C-terminal domain-containing protein [Oscillospiraceae bacterium]
MSNQPAPAFMRWGNTLLITHPWITPENITDGTLDVRLTVDRSLPPEDWARATVAESPFGANATFTAELPQFFNLWAFVKLADETSETGFFSVLPQSPKVDYAPGAYLPEDFPKSVVITSESGTQLRLLSRDRTILNELTPSNRLEVDIHDGTELIVAAVAIVDLQEFPSYGVTLKYTIDPNLKKLAPDTIEDVIREMTVEDKVALTGGIGGDPTVYINDGPAGATYAIPRLGIPGLVLADGPAGVRMRKNASVWLSPTGMASTWNLPLVEEVGQRVAAEATHYAVDVILAPGLNVQRNPLGGRNFEYYSEDPTVTGLVGAAYVRGVQSGGVGTSPKHFAGNDQENFRGQGNVVTTERALREIYLRGFETVAKESPWTYMCAYNAVNGTLANANEWLMTETLRKLWGYDGLVMSDWGADYDPVKSLIAQMDLGEPTRNAAPVLAWINDTAIDDGERARRVALLDVAVRNTLKLVLKSHAYKGAYGALQIDGSYGADGLTREIINQRSTDFGGSAIQLESAAVNRRLAGEGIVLLKNENALPLVGGTKISLVTSEIAWDELDVQGWYGCTASLGDIVTQGRGSAQVKFNADGGTKWSPTLREGLAGGGFDVVEWKRDGEIAGTGDLPHGEALGQDQGAQIAAKESDVLAAANRALELGAEVFVFVMTRVSGEGQDVIPEEFALCARESSVFAPYADAFRAAGKKVVVLLNCGSAVDTTLYRAKADAILDVYNPGTEGSNAIADILSGAVSPSGKLTQSFPKTYSDSPSVAVVAAGHEGRTFGTNPVYYDEGVYVGYRYFDTFDEGGRVAYPFGHGLSYTTFAFSNLTLDKSAFEAAVAGETVTATVDVTNTGARAGKEVVQLYLGASTYKEERRPVRELRAFAKTRLLSPGETERVTLTLTLRDLQYYDDGNAEQREVVEQYTDGKQWRVESGTVFTVTVGELSANFEVK